MRAPVALVAALAVLAGCVSHSTETPASSNPANAPLSTQAAGGSPPALTVLAPLVSEVTATGASWVKPGDAIDVPAAPPANARGTVEYAWLWGNIAGVGP